MVYKKEKKINNSHEQTFSLEDRVFVYFYVYFYTAWGNLITKSLSSMLGVKFKSTILKQNYSLGILNAYFFNKPQDNYNKQNLTVYRNDVRNQV